MGLVVVGVEAAGLGRESVVKVFFFVEFSETNGMGPGNGLEGLDFTADFWFTNRDEIT